MHVRTRRCGKPILWIGLILIFSVFVYFELGYVVTSRLARTDGTHVCKVKKSPVSMPKNSSSLTERAEKSTHSHTRKDWFKNCLNLNSTNEDIRRRCLKELDLGEQKNCDTPCQEVIQEYRKLNTKQACANYSQHSYSPIWNKKGQLKQTGVKLLHHLIPIENSKIIFCYIPKDGCTAWKRILLTVAGHIDSPSFQTDDIHLIFKAKLKSLAKFSRREAEIRLKTYKKFLFVREPMERMLSLFLDKAVKNNDLHFKENQYEDFLKFITKQPSLNIPTHFREHWTHASNLCLPCDISYDFIGRLETSKRDTNYIFDHFILKNRDRLVMFHEENHPTNSSDSDKKSKYYQQVSKDVLKKAINKYHRDYVLFNYDKPAV